MAIVVELLRRKRADMQAGRNVLPQRTLTLLANEAGQLQDGQAVTFKIVGKVSSRFDDGSVVLEIERVDSSNEKESDEFKIEPPEKAPVVRVSPAPAPS